MEENKRMLEDVSDSRARLNLLMVEKEKVANVLRGMEKAKEELESLAEENNQLDIDIKVDFSLAMMQIPCGPDFFIFFKIELPCQRCHLLFCH